MGLGGGAGPSLNWGSRQLRGKWCDWKLCLCWSWLRGDLNYGCTSTGRTEWSLYDKRERETCVDFDNRDTQEHKLCVGVSKEWILSINNIIDYRSYNESIYLGSGEFSISALMEVADQSYQMYTNKCAFSSKYDTLWFNNTKGEGFIRSKGNQSIYYMLQSNKKGDFFLQKFIWNNLLRVYFECFSPPLRFKDRNYKSLREVLRTTVWKNNEDVDRKL